MNIFSRHQMQYIRISCSIPKLIFYLQLYSQLKQYIPKKDSLIELDRNPDNFEAFLEQASSPGPDQLTVGHVRRFVPCTSNLDPYLRKLIRGILEYFLCELLPPPCFIVFSIRSLITGSKLDCRIEKMVLNTFAYLVSNQFFKGMYVFPETL